MALPPHVALLVQTAKQEYANYKRYLETDPPLLNRIYRYCDDLGFSRPSDITQFKWSAVFVSWCLYAAGATSSQFKFSIRHAVFVKWAIKNADKKSGLYRALPIDRYKPQPGDIIHYNVENGTVTYAQARKDDTYGSHSAIVVEIKRISGKYYAVTVGGNEGDTVGKSWVELTASRFIKRRRLNPYIAVIQNRKTSISHRVAANRITSGVELVPAVLPRGLARSLSGHGTYIYRVAETVAQYGSVENVIDALKSADMQHVWVPIHGLRGFHGRDRALVEALVTEAREAGMAVAGWGWCQGANVDSDARLARRESARYRLHDYVAHISNGVNNSYWMIQDVERFCQKVRQGIGGSFAISTSSPIDWHKPELMEASLAYVDAFGVQIDWGSFPDRKMVGMFPRTHRRDFRVDDPAEYVDLCLDRWDRRIGGLAQKLILTGQAGGHDGTAEQATTDRKVVDFLSRWSNFPMIAGLNWWYFGGSGGMSRGTLKAINDARLGSREYR